MKIYSFIYPATPYPIDQRTIFGSIMEKGWGNGYVALPPEHPYHGIGYDSIEVDVHGGLTYAEEAHRFKDRPTEIPDDYWILGFDTSHLNNNPRDQDELFVKLQTEHLKKQLLEMSEHKIMVTRLSVECPDCGQLNTIKPPMYRTSFIGETICDYCSTNFHYWYEEN